MDLDEQSEGNGGMEWSRSTPTSASGLSLRMEDMTPATGELTFAAEGNGTKVVWTMNSNAGMNPIFRWFSLFMDKDGRPRFRSRPEKSQETCRGIVMSETLLATERKTIRLSRLRGAAARRRVRHCA